MADPFSISIAVVSLLDVCIRAGAYLAQIKEAAGKVEDDIAALSHDIEALVSVNESIKHFWNGHRGASAPAGTTAENAGRIKDTWKNVGRNLRDCEATVGKLSLLLQSIIGKEGSKVTGKFDGLRKALRKQSKEEDFEKLRKQLADYRSSLQLLFTTLNFSYTVSSQDSADQLSETVEHMRFKLQSELATLRPRLRTTDENGDILRDSINSAAAVASSVSLNKHFHIPQTVSSIYTGRQALLDKLKNTLNATSPLERNHTQRRFVLYGLGGSGKTQFCCKFAQDNRKDFWGIFWIDASSDESAKHTFSRIAKIGDVDSNIAAAKNWLSTREKPWLLLIDNADDPDMNIEDYFPEGERGFILVTTRNPANKVHGTIGSQFFEKLETMEANDLLLKAACEPSPYKESSKESASLITKELGCLPLALVHAGTAIRHRLCSLANYLNFYKTYWQKIRETRSENANMNVYSSYEIIYQSLEERKTEEARDAVELLKIFSFLHCENIRIEFFIHAVTNPRLEQDLQEKVKNKKDTVSIISKPKPWTEFLNEQVFGLLEALLRDRSRPVLPEILRDSETSISSDEIRLNVALAKLSQMSLITHHETTESYSMHPLVHRWVRERRGMRTGEQAIWCQATTTILAQCILLPPLGSTEADEAMRRDLLPHVIHVQKCQEEIQARIDKARQKRKRTWPVLTATLDRRQALVLAKFSRVYAQCGHWKEAEQLQRTVKDFICPLLGLQHTRSMDIMLALSGTIWQQTRFNEAADLQDQVLQACLSSLGPDHPKTLKVMDILGATRCHQGRFWEAEELHQKAITGMTTALGLDHEDTIIAQNNLARVWFWLFRYEEAKDLHLKSLEGMRKVLGPKHLQTLSAMEHLAMDYLEIGGEHLNAAHNLMLEVVAQREKTLGKEHAWTLAARLSLARVKTALNQLAEVETMLVDGIPIARRNLGDNHFGTIAARAFYAQLLVRLRRYGEAEEIYNDVLERQRFSGGAQKDGHHPDRLMFMYHLIECYQQQGKIEEATQLCNELSQILVARKSIHPFVKWVEDKGEELKAARYVAIDEASLVGVPIAEEPIAQPP